MDKEEEQEQHTTNATIDPNTALIDSFCEITSASRGEAVFFLESHQWNLNAAVFTFLEGADAADARLPVRSPSQLASPSRSAASSPSRSRSPSPPLSRAPYSLRSRPEAVTRSSSSSFKKSTGGRTSGVRTLSDLNRTARDGSGSDSDEPQEYYTGGEKSGMLVRDPSKHNDVDAIFDQARQSGAVEAPADSVRPSSSSKSFTGTGRLLSGETVPSAPQPPEAVNHTVIFWSNGFTVDDGPLRRLDDPENASFLESIRKSECPKELEPAGRGAVVHVNLTRRDENYTEPVKRRIPFQGMGRTLGSSSESETAQEPGIAATIFNTAPLPSMGLVVDEASPSTSIQLRLADGTRLVSRFNYHHTISDIRAFIDASRPGGARTYQLQAMGFPPKQLTDLDQTIEQAGLASSVVIQKF
ncbi:plant UBX domain-containing protein 4-like [Malania oleifera]|uniref:plant UBX domain-containing protein 4-like n=1 Tax=Malania oleifera TaxID=397392 RepID=UPI0025AE35FF|nr:plant UBX domain-containing protein 4-like [Malania oleifera]